MKGDADDDDEGDGIGNHVDVVDEDEVERQTQISTQKQSFCNSLKNQFATLWRKMYILSHCLRLLLLLLLLVVFVLTLNLLTQCNLTLSRNLIIIFTHLPCVQKANRSDYCENAKCK